MELNETNAAETKVGSNRWDELVFDGKMFCVIDEQGALRVSGYGDRVLTVLNPANAVSVLQLYSRKYAELNAETERLQQEMNASDDKGKWAYKFQKLKEQFEQASAVGDINALRDKIDAALAIARGAENSSYQAKLTLTEEAENLNAAEDIKKADARLKEIIDLWKSAGFVDKARNEALWARLEQVKARLVSEKRHRHEDLGHEMMQNLDLKMELVDKAEALAASKEWKKTTEAFKDLMDEWKKIGRTLPEKNELLWQRFIAAKNSFFDRKKQHTGSIREVQEANMQQKKALIEKAEAMRESTDWSNTAQAYHDLMEEWKKIGPAPAEHNNKLWDQFCNAKTVFFDAKRKHSETFRNQLQENHDKKKALADRAEAIKNSTRWRETTDELNQLFEQWKQIGHTGKEHGNALWQQFISARKHFFNRKDQERDRKKQLFEKHQEVRDIQTRNQFIALETEQADDAARIAEFEESLRNNIDGPKAEQLRQHMQQLIVEIKARMDKRSEKIARMKQQVAEADGSENLSPQAE